LKIETEGLLEKNSLKKKQFKKMLIN